MGLLLRKLDLCKAVGIQSRYMAGIRVNEKEPHGGCLCVSCETEMQWISINGFLIGYFCQNDECVRYGLLCQAWKEKLPYVEAATIEA